MGRRVSGGSAWRGPACDHSAFREVRAWFCRAGDGPVCADEPPHQSFCVLRSWRERLVGLLGTSRGDCAARPVLLTGCSSVHTFGMRYPIDVAFVDERGVVVGAQRGLAPGRLMRATGACWALERPSSRAVWPVAGDVLRLELGDGAALPQR